MNVSDVISDIRYYLSFIRYLSSRPPTIVSTIIKQFLCHWPPPWRRSIAAASVPRRLSVARLWRGTFARTLATGRFFVPIAPMQRHKKAAWRNTFAHTRVSGRFSVLIVPMQRHKKAAWKNTSAHTRVSGHISVHIARMRGQHQLTCRGTCAYTRASGRISARTVRTRRQHLIPSRRTFAHTLASGCFSAAHATQSLFIAVRRGGTSPSASTMTQCTARAPWRS